MIVTLPLVALCGILLFFLLRARYLGYGSAITAALFGFYLASTGAGPAVTTLTHTVIHAIAQIAS